MNQDEFDQLKPDDLYTSNDAFSIPDDFELEGYPPTEDPFSKYSTEDPPALIACVACLSYST